MSSPEYAPLKLTPGKSGRLAVWVIAVHAAALGALTQFHGVPWIVRGVLALAVIAGGIHSLRTHALRTTARSIVTAGLREDGWLLTLRDGRELRAEPVGAFVHPRLVIVRLKGEGGQFTLVIADDALPKEDHRRLRVRLCGV